GPGRRTAPAPRRDRLRVRGARRKRAPLAQRALRVPRRAAGHASVLAGAAAGARSAPADPERQGAEVLAPGDGGGSRRSLREADGLRILRDRTRLRRIAT